MVANVAAGCEMLPAEELKENMNPLKKFKPKLFCSKIRMFRK